MRILFSIVSSVFISAGSLWAQDLKENKEYQLGISALTDHLYPLAISKFDKALTTENISDADKLEILLTKTETQIRAILPAQALETLESPLLANHPEKTYWKGIALVVSGRFSEAENTLREVTPKSRYHEEAQLTLANLMLTLSKNAEAESLLSSVSKSKKTNLSDDASIKLTELYLTTKQFGKASKAMATIRGTSPVTQKTKKILSARILFYKKDYASAISQLKELLQSPEYVSQRIYNNAFLTLIDAIHASGDTEAALEEIVMELERTPDSPIIHLLFSRLSTWLTLENLSSTTIGATNTPIIDKLKQWANRNISAAKGTPTPLAQYEGSKDLEAYAHYYYARYFSLSDQPSDLRQALYELSLFRLRHPTHLLAGASLIDTARAQLALGLKDDAVDTLNLVENINLNISPDARQQASFLKGELLADRMDYALSAKAFEKATVASNKAISDAAILNTGISYLAASNQKEFDQLINTVNNEKLETELTLERALWLAKSQDIDARPLLQQFIKSHPNHPRANEIRLRLANHALTTQPINTDIAAENLAILTAIHAEAATEMTKLTDLQIAKLYTTKYQFAIITANYPLAIEAANAFIETFPNSERVDEFTLLKGQAFFRNGQQNQARRILEKFATNKPDSPLSPFALYYASLAARLEGTPQSQVEAIALFERVIAIKSPIQKEASLQLADLYRSLNQLDEAKKILTNIYNPKSKSSLDRDIAINLASVHHELGIADPLNYQKSIDIYDNILKDKELPDFWKNRVNYRKANTYQHMGDNLKAEETYYSVVNVDKKNTPITEWTWYYRCGFNAIAMLEEQGNPKGAIAIANKLAKSGGPRSVEAAERARQLEMKYMIWGE